MNRRNFLLAGSVLIGGAVSTGQARAADGDGTPLQFMPKKPKDSAPLENEFDKYPKCPYCGMDRKEYHFSRHLVHYSDDLVDGTCSLHCAAISLSLNLDRVPKAIYAADFGSPEKIKPLTNAEAAAYIIGGSFRLVMSKVPKTAFASQATAEEMRGTGVLADFDRALMLTYTSMAEDTKMIRMRRDEKRKAAAAAAAQGQAAGH
jgi:copper chaperone NosL